MLFLSPNLITQILFISIAVFEFGHFLRMEEEKKTATIMEEPRDGLHEKQKPGRRYGRI